MNPKSNGKTKDNLIDFIRSPIITGELIKHLSSINPLTIADAITKHLDIQLTGKDTVKVKAELAKKLKELAIALTSLTRKETK